MTDTFADYVRASNIADNVEVYERENAAIDPVGVLWQALRDSADWSARTLVDLGCGTGFWLPRYATGIPGRGGAAASVIGVEPDPRLRELAAQRVAGSPSIRVVAGSAEHLPLPDESVDIIHARFAYFFPPRCEPGLHEALRVLRPGGSLVVIDNDMRDGEFAGLLSRSPWAPAQGTPDVTDAWWAARGGRRRAVMSAWRCGDPAELAAVLRIEFPGDLVDDWVAAHPARHDIGYGYVLFTVLKPAEISRSAGQSRR